ncbi:MAG: class A beta-lactamase [Rhodanobacter sp.]
MKRRDLLKGLLTGISALVLAPAFGRGTAGMVGPDAEGALAALERLSGGRLGVSILDTATGHRIGHRGDERFLMCSTFKLLAVAAVLARVDQGMEQLDRHVMFDKSVLLEYAPVTSRQVGAPGMTIAGLCEAAITVSDNTAANLLLSSLGGPNSVTTFVRGLGDPVTRLDRTEPELNLGSPDDIRDTTTPDAMLATMHKLLLGSALSVNSRGRLLGWLRNCRTGAEKLRAGLPSTWAVGDKTGSGSQGETNDVAIVWPPGRGPLLVAAYYAGSDVSPSARNSVLANVGRIAASI